MCDAQEIDRLCKTQPTGENNNNNNNCSSSSRRRDGHVKTEPSDRRQGRGSGRCNRVRRSRSRFCFFVAVVVVGRQVSVDIKGRQVRFHVDPAHHRRSRQESEQIWLCCCLRDKRRTKTSKRPEPAIIKAGIKNVKRIVKKQVRRDLVCGPKPPAAFRTSGTFRGVGSQFFPLSSNKLAAARTFPTGRPTERSLAVVF